METVDHQRSNLAGESAIVATRVSQSKAPHLVWVFPTAFANRLDSATWLKTTKDLRGFGWQVTLIGMGNAGIQQVDGVETLGIPRPDVYLFGNVLYHINVLRYIVKRLDEIDIVLFNQVSAIWLLPLRLLRAIKGQSYPKIVMDTRDLSDAKPGDFKSAARIAFVKLNHWLANHFADGQTTITPRFVDLVNIPKDQLWGIWPSGVDPEPFANAAVMRRWPEGDEPIRLVYIGVLLEKRHPLQLCKAVKAALKKGWSFELFFYGDGPEAEQIRQCSAESGGRIKVMPPIAHEDVPSMLAKMHIGVTSLPDVDDAKYAASSPIKLFEYMASGLPILATTNPCHTEVVGDGSFASWAKEPSEAGILEALEQIWAQRGSLGEKGREAQEKVLEWTWEAAAIKLDKALRNGLEQQMADAKISL